MLDIQQKIIKYNFTKGRTGVDYIVIHDTGNTNAGADAEAHYNYFGGANRNASAHYFVDDHQIIQVIEDSNAAWHCGDGKGKYGIKNSNSIGVEICVNQDGDYDKAVSNAVELAATLLKKYNLSLDRLKRHYDASRKTCPASMSANNWAAWELFVSAVKAALDGTTAAPSQKPVVFGHVANVQRWLNQEYGFALEIDNSAGPLTWTALRKALQMEINRQGGAGLEIDGSIGPKTKAAIIYTKRGTKGNITKLVQAALYCKGYDPNGLDGGFGPGTEAAVRKYQAAHGLTVDGMAGRETQVSLFRV